MTDQQQPKTKVYLYISSLINDSNCEGVDIKYEQHCDNLGMSQWDLENILRELEHEGEVKLFCYANGAYVELRNSRPKYDRCK